MVAGVLLKVGHQVNWVAVRMSFPTRFDHVEESFLIKKFSLKGFIICTFSHQVSKMNIKSPNNSWYPLISHSGASCTAQNEDCKLVKDFFTTRTTLISQYNSFTWQNQTGCSIHRSLDRGPKTLPHYTIIRRIVHCRLLSWLRNVAFKVTIIVNEILVPNCISQKCILFLGSCVQRLVVHGYQERSFSS